MKNPTELTYTKSFARPVCYGIKWWKQLGWQFLCPVCVLENTPSQFQWPFCRQTMSLCTPWHDIRIYIRLYFLEIKNYLYAFLLRVSVLFQYNSLCNFTSNSFWMAFENRLESINIHKYFVDSAVLISLLVISIIVFMLTLVFFLLFFFTKIFIIIIEFCLYLGNVFQHFFRIFRCSLRG